MRPSKLSIFTNWIKDYGPTELAKKLDVHHTTVQKWSIGHLPRASQMTRIKDLSKGIVSYDVMIEGAQEAGKQ